MSSTNNVISIGSGNATTTNQSASQSAITLSNSTPSPATSTPQIPQVSAPPKAKRRRRVNGPRKCGLCGQSGHNRRTCNSRGSLVPQHLKPSAQLLLRLLRLLLRLATPAVAPATPAVTAPRPTPKFPVGVGSCVLLSPISIKDLSVGKKVKATYKGGMRTYSATVTAVDMKNYTISLKYEDGDTAKNVIWYEPFVENLLWLV